MLGYVTLGTNDLQKSASFYDELFKVCGGKRLMEIDSFILWGTNLESASFAITKPFDGKAATVGNGVMVAINAGTKEMADALYNKAIELGAKDEGAPGPRGEGFYAGYFRDLDGNKLNAFVAG